MFIVPHFNVNGSITNWNLIWKLSGLKLTKRYCDKNKKTVLQFNSNPFLILKLHNQTKTISSISSRLRRKVIGLNLTVRYNLKPFDTKNPKLNKKETKSEQNHSKVRKSLNPQTLITHRRNEYFKEFFN